MKKTSSQKGFTIIETLVAITILMISIAGPLTIAHKGLLAAFYAHDQVTASYLAQDALEYIKNVKDNNLLMSRPWLAGINDNTIDCEFTNCTVDTVAGDPTGVSSRGITNCSSNCILYNGTLGYRPTLYVGSTPSSYSRTFYVITKNNDEIQVIVEVTWNSGTIQNVVTYESELFNILK